MKTLKLFPLCFAIVMLALTACEKNVIEIQNIEEAELRRGFTQASESPSIIVDWVVLDEPSSMCLSDIDVVILDNWTIDVTASTGSPCSDASIVLVNSGGTFIQTYPLGGLTTVNTIMEVTECGNYSLLLIDNGTVIFDYTAFFYLGFNNPDQC